MNGVPTFRWVGLALTMYGAVIALNGLHSRTVDILLAFFMGIGFGIVVFGMLERTP